MSEINKFVICAEFENEKYPILEISDSGDQLVIRFVHTKNHWTVHRSEDCMLVNPDSLLLTSTVGGKMRDWKDEERVSIAKKFGYKNPERHGEYIHHSCLSIISNTQGYELGGYRLNLSTNNNDQEYLKKCVKVFKVHTCNPLCLITLSTSKNNSILSEGGIKVNLGEIFFNFE